MRPLPLAALLLLAPLAALPAAALADCSQQVVKPGYLLDARCAFTEQNDAPLASCSATVGTSTQGAIPLADARCAVPGAGTEACVQTFAPNGPGQWWVYVVDLVALGQQRTPPPTC